MRREQTPLKAKLSQSDAAALYDRLATIYDIWARLTESKAQRRALELANIEDGQHVLEVAVGTGLAFEHVAKKNVVGRNVGIDISRGMLAKAEQRLRRAGLSNYELRLGSAAEIQERDNSFDVILNSYMFDLLHEHEWEAVLGEYHRVLKPGAKLVLVNMTVGESAGSGIYEAIYRLSPALIGGCRGVQFSAVLERNRFSVHSREYVQQLLFPSEVILATTTA
jgi:ubiquinone/menaquinone biosynthesis C-methylase UbiE